MNEETHTPSLPPNYNETVYVTYFTMNTLSLIGQLFIIITYFSIRKSSNSFYSYVANHCFISFPWLITNYITVPLGDRPSAGCTAMAFINTGSYTASMIWSTVIAWVIFSGLKKQKRISKVAWYSTFGVVLLALCFTIYALLTDSFGPFRGIGINYCWFDRTIGSTVSYWVPFIATTVLDLLFYVRSIFIVKQNASEETSKAFLALLIFPLIQIFCNSGGIVRKIAEFMGDTESTYLEVLHFICAKGQGLYEALAYGLNRSVRAEIYKVWCKNRARKRNDMKTPIVSSINDRGSIDSDSIEKERNQRGILIEL